MPAQVSALSQTLQSLTLSKIRELEKQRSSYEDRKAHILAAAEAESHLPLRVTRILTGTKSTHPTAAKDPMVVNIERWLQQNSYDSSVTDDMLREFETELRTRLDAHSRRLSLADLYSRLLTEWTNSPEGAEEEEEDMGGVGAPEEEDFMVVDERQKQRLLQLVDQFEQTVFTPLETDEGAIHGFLDRLFPDDEKMAAMASLREEIAKDSQNIFDEEAPFTQVTLEATIKGLLTEDILSDEKQGVLRDFVKNKVALTEIADVLNMRWADLENWDWYAGEEGIPVLPRQQLNGKYRIWMDEDVLQLIFVQYIGTRLCNLLKKSLKDFIEPRKVWNWEAGPPLTEADKERRTYYLGSAGSRDYAEATRKSDYLDRYFLSQLPLSLTTLADGGAPYDDEDSDYEDSDDEDGDNVPTQSADGQRHIKQQLLRKIATETLINKHIYSQAAVIQSDLKWYATGLPHSTIFAVMSYLGFSAKWLHFFHKYLASPLNLDQAAEGRVPVGPRRRARGVPMAHSSEKFIGEMILFFMDLAVNRTTGLLLYRLHDDLWLCGEPAKCAQAWEVMGAFAAVTGLEFNTSKTGSVYLANSIDPMIEARLPKGAVTFGFLALDRISGEWVIDMKQVEAHVRQLKRQLEGCEGVMAWIRTWNSCIGRFFKNTFGQPAMCFGQAHVDSILTTYKMMQEALFGGSGTTVTQHLRQMIVSRFGISDIPDALFYYPEELGGLGLRNPFISPFLVRDSMKGSPQKNLMKYEEEEEESYSYLKKRFQDLHSSVRSNRFRTASEGGFVSQDEKDTFFPYPEWVAFRWSHSHAFQKLYTGLQGTPLPKNIKSTTAVSEALAKALSSAQIRNRDAEQEWILELYAPEVLRKYGGVSLVDKKYLPVGVMTMVKEKRVKWQMVL